MQNFSSKLQAQILGRKCALYFNPATICLKAFHTFFHLQLSDFEIFYFELCAAAVLKQNPPFLTHRSSQLVHVESRFLGDAAFTQLPGPCASKALWHSLHGRLGKWEPALGQNRGSLARSHVPKQQVRPLFSPSIHSLKHLAPAGFHYNKPALLLIVLI